MAKRDKTMSETSESTGYDDTGVAEHEALPQLPQGYEDRSADALGVWDSRNPQCSRVLHFIPTEANIMDNSVKPDRASIFVIGKLVQPCTVFKVKSDGEMVNAGVGDLVGIWYSPGMRGIETMHGIKTFIYFEGEVEMGKGKNPMRKYRIAAPAGAKAKRVPIRGDFRKDSKGIPTVFDDPNAEGSDGVGAQPF